MSLFGWVEDLFAGKQSAQLSLQAVNSAILSDACSHLQSVRNAFQGRCCFQISRICGSQRRAGFIQSFKISGALPRRRYIKIGLWPIGGDCGILTRGGFTQPTLSLGLVHLGRNRRRLPGLWLEAKGADPFSRRPGHDRRVVPHHQRVAHVAGLSRCHARRLVVVAAGILNPV